MGFENILGGLGGMAPAAGGIIGGMMGGPAGAMLGSGIGGLAAGALGGAALAGRQVQNPMSEEQRRRINGAIDQSTQQANQAYGLANKYAGQPMDYMAGVASGQTRGATQELLDYQRNQNLAQANALANSAAGGVNPAMLQRQAQNQIALSNNQANAQLAPLITQERQQANQNLFNMVQGTRDYQTKLMELARNYEMMGLSSNQAFMQAQNQLSAIQVQNQGQQNQLWGSVLGGGAAAGGWENLFGGKNTGEAVPGSMQYQGGMLGSNYDLGGQVAPSASSGYGLGGNYTF